jgi:hypothetical protein
MTSRRLPAPWQVKQIPGSTFSLNRLGRFRESDVSRHVFERVVWTAMTMGLVKGEGFAVDASVLKANASRYQDRRCFSLSRRSQLFETTNASAAVRASEIKAKLAGLIVDRLD